MSDKKEIKVVLVGESQTGKTSLLNCFKGEQFNENTKSTLGASCYNLELEYKKKPMVFQVWDTAGDEKYHSINRYFYKDASVVIIVYDITNPMSFDCIKDYWIEEIKHKTNTNPVCLIVANKSDLFADEQVPEKEARDFAEKHNALFYSISCKDGSGIKELINGMASSYASRSKDIKRDKGNEKNIVIDNRSFIRGKDKKKSNCC